MELTSGKKPRLFTTITNAHNYEHKDGDDAMTKTDAESNRQTGQKKQTYDKEEHEDNEGEGRAGGKDENRGRKQGIELTV